MAADSSAPTLFDALQTLLATARELATDLLSDPLLARLLHAFLMFPESDREPILQVIEKDAAWRRIVEQTAGATGITVHPNPHASLYVHVLNQTAEPSARDANVIRFGIETFVQLFPLLFQEGVYAQWTAAAREIARAADAELRALGIRLVREVEAIIAEVDAERTAPTE
jgi:hypothetical protein